MEIQFRNEAHHRAHSGGTRTSSYESYAVRDAKRSRVIDRVTIRMVGCCFSCVVRVV